MARIIGGLTSSHIPAVGAAYAKKQFEDPYWKPFFEGYPPVHKWLAEQKPDVAIVFYNDHGLNFFLDKMPTFAIGAAFEYENQDEGWGIPAIGKFQGYPELSWRIIDGVVADGFDVCSCQEMAVDHGFSVPVQLFWGDQTKNPIKTVPICVNTVQHPVPTPMRCYRFGQAIGRAIAAFPGAEKVVILGTGGMSHQLDGKRAGFINKKFDLMCMEKIVDDPEELAKISTADLIQEAGAQGLEFILWLAMRGCLNGKVKRLHQNYHIPISNTAAGTLLLENAA
jgi:protocatechuate 4,5-dioxygenase beta chain